MRFLSALAGAVAVAAFAGTLLAPRDASAYCRTVSAKTPANYDPAQQGCFTGDPNAGPVYDLFWRNLCVGYSLQKNGTKLAPFDQIKQKVASAFRAWSDVTCPGGGAPSITASELEPPGQEGVECDKIQYNPYGPNSHTIIFRDDGWPYPGDTVNTLGLTTVTYDVTSGQIFDADMEINSNLVAMPGSGPYDLQAILTHEAGHFLGLAHSADPNAVMYALYHATDSKLQPDDVQGICAIDPPGGTRNTSGGAIQGDSCCPTPRHGFMSVCAPVGADGGVVPPASGTTEPEITEACQSDTAAENPTDTSSGCAAAPGPVPLRYGLAGVAAFGVALGVARRRRRA